MQISQLGILIRSRVVMPRRVKLWGQIIQSDTEMGALFMGAITITIGLGIGALGTLGLELLGSRAQIGFVLSAIFIGAPTWLIILSESSQHQNKYKLIGGWLGMLVIAALWGAQGEAHSVFLGWMVTSVAVLFLLGGVLILWLAQDVARNRKILSKGGWDASSPILNSGWEEESGRWVACLVESALVRGRTDEALAIIKAADGQRLPGWRQASWADNHWAGQEHAWMQAFWLGCSWTARSGKMGLSHRRDAREIAEVLARLGSGQGIWAVICKDIHLWQPEIRKRLISQVLVSPNKEERITALAFLGRAQDDSGEKLVARNSGEGAGKETV